MPPHSADHDRRVLLFRDAGVVQLLFNLLAAGETVDGLLEDCFAISRERVRLFLYIADPQVAGTAEHAA